MRTPWREALDGKIRTIRDFKSEASFNQTKSYFRESNTLQRTIPRHRLDQAVTEIATLFMAHMDGSLHAAEPFWIRDDITKELFRRCQATEFSSPKGAFLTPYRRTELPVREGIAWFQNPVEVVSSEMSTDVLGRDSRGIFVRGVFFGDVFMLSTTRDGHIQTESQDDRALGVVAIIDPELSWGPSRTHRGLIPWICNRLEEGQNVHEYSSAVRRNAPDLEPLDIAISVWPVLFCRVFFKLLAERQLRYGGSGLERDARRQAERYGFSPSVQVVDWRKATYQYPEGHIPQWVDWRHQWVVRPHMRRLKSGKVVNVRSYTKGPADKPFKMPRERINLVRH